MAGCEICGKAGKLRICKICGRKVCPEHFDEKRNICVACAETLCEVCGNKLSIGNCAYCGRLVCEDCSMEIGPALVCRECYQKIERLSLKL